MSDFSSKFDQHFQKCFVAFVMRDSEFLQEVAADLSPELFSDSAMQRIVRVCLDFHAQEKSAPDMLIFRLFDQLRDQGALGQDTYAICSKLADELFATRLQNRRYLLSEFQSFLRHQMFRQLLPIAVEHERKGEFDKCEQTLQKVFTYKPRRALDLGRQLDADPDARVRRRQTEDGQRFWTLIPELDRRIDGLRPGELGVWLSQRSSAGKSAALAFLARSAAFQGRRVVIYTLEMSEEAYEDRLDQTISGLTKKDLRDETAIKTRMAAMLRHGGSIWIKKFPQLGTKISDLRKHWEMLQSVHNFRADVVLIDYADLLDPETPELKVNSNEAAHEVYSAYTSWLGEEGIVSWTGSQSNREAMQEAVADQAHVAKGIAKMQIAHLVISLNRSPEEETQGIIRLYIAKAREDAARYEIPIRTDFSRQQFWAGGKDLCDVGST